jgi:hypothetical protein
VLKELKGLKDLKVIQDHWDLKVHKEYKGLKVQIMVLLDL